MKEKQFLMYYFEEFKGKKKFLCAWMVEAERPRKALQDIWKLIYKTLCIARSIWELNYTDENISQMRKCSCKAHWQFVYHSLY